MGGGGWEGMGGGGIGVDSSDSLYPLTLRVCTCIGGLCCSQPSDEQSVWSIAGHQPGHSGDMVPRPFRLSGAQAIQVIWCPGHSGYLVSRPFRLSGAWAVQVLRPFKCKHCCFIFRYSRVLSF